MLIKLDENLPARLADDLAQLGHEVDTVVEEGLAGSDDSIVWTAAQQENRFFITQDLDFSDLRRYRPGSHAGLLLLRIRTPDRETIRLRVLRLFSSEPVETWSRCFVIATDSKLRIRSA